MSLPQGTRLGPYEILAPLGAGGMGEVYRASDPRLGREVAIKVLPAALTDDPERLRRFAQEARAASALNHPNILTVHDVGDEARSPYLVTELLRGEILRDVLQRGPLPVEKTLEFARELASGLAAAHDKDIIHRDLKPDNIFVTSDGRVKILDFGLAKLRQPESAGTASMTETGVLLGTLGYLSPEQAEGKPLDRRSDIFSLGAVLFEMLTGQHAFPGNSLASLVAVMQKDPPRVSEIRPEVPTWFAAVVQRCMAKAPEDRFQSAGELVAAIDSRKSASRRSTPVAWAAAALLLIAVTLAAAKALPRFFGGITIDAVAVLPFATTGDTTDAGFVATGLTDGLIAELAQVGALKVISRSSGELASAKPLDQVAKELGVGAVVKGSLRKSGDSVYVTVALLDPAGGTPRWSRDYSATLDGLPHLEREIALAIADASHAELARDEQARLAAGAEVDRRAYEAYLRGRFHMERDELDRARAFFEQARSIAPNWAPSYVGLANYYTTLPFASDIPPVDVLPKAREMVVKALELDETLADAHAAFAYIRAYYEWDWQAAEKEFKRALELRPSNADVHFSYSRFLASRSRMDESLAQIARAMELDPLSLPLRANTALLNYFGGKYQEALSQLDETLAADSTSRLALWGKALVLEQLGKPKEAIAILEPMGFANLNRVSSLGHAYAIAGRSAEARMVLDTLEAKAKTSYVPAYYFAVVHAGLEHQDEALRWLDRAYQERSTVLAYLRIDPRLATLRSNPRFEELVRRIGGT